MFCCRGSSIKTRIETLLLFTYRLLSAFVAEVVPLKQGLKRECDTEPFTRIIGVAEVVPLKQGLKPTRPKT